MGVVAAQEGDVQQVGQLHVVGELRAPGEQARVFVAFDGLAEVAGGHGSLFSFHAPRGMLSRTLRVQVKSTMQHELLTAASSNPQHETQSVSQRIPRRAWNEGVKSKNVEVTVTAPAR